MGPFRVFSKDSERAQCSSSSGLILGTGDGTLVTTEDRLKDKVMDLGSPMIPAVSIRHGYDAWSKGGGQGQSGTRASFGESSSGPSFPVEPAARWSLTAPTLPMPSTIQA
ncbi:hypothetical protein Nmel_007883 [Mimus melanotis]